MKRILASAALGIAVSLGLAHVAAAHHSFAMYDTGKTYVKVVLPDGWVRGKELVVCGMVQAEAIPGLVPLPEDRMIRFASRMSIEVVAAGQTETGGAEALPGGASWGTWCA